MYNRYVKNDQGSYQRAFDAERAADRTGQGCADRQPAAHMASGILSSLWEKITSLDSGDLLLLVLLFLLLKEGSDDELLIALGLLLIL